MTGPMHWPLMIGRSTLPVLASSPPGTVLILDAASGQVVGGIPVAVSLAGSPAVSDGQIYLAGLDGQIYKMKEQ